MNHKLHLLDSFPARGSDGNLYKVRAFEQLARDDSPMAVAREMWEPTGRTECRLDDGRCVELTRDGVMRIAGTDVSLQQEGVLAD